MTISTIVRYSFGVLISAILLGCGGVPSSQSLLADKQGNAYTLQVNPQQSNGASWMDHRASSGQLLYIADAASSNVYVYSYPKGTLAGTLTGFQGPRGLCVDAAGDVWVTNLFPSGPSTVVEYAHGGTTPIATLEDSGQYPFSCSVDPNTGNLAVANLTASFGSPGGSVAIYAGAKGTPTLYTDPDIFRLPFVGYDAQSNLFADGGSFPSGTYYFAELANGSSNFINLTTIKRNSEDPIQWDGKYVARGGNKVIYRTVAGKVVGTTHLKGACNAVTQFFIRKNAVVGLNGYGSCLHQAQIYAYPTGELPTKVLKLPQLQEPAGVAISQ